MYDIAKINQIAKGNWFSIFAAAGISTKGNKKHEPCPMCGGRDRFRIDDKNGSGSWICNHCGAGDGLELIKLYMGNFKDAIEFVAGYLGISEEKEIDWQAVNKRKAEAAKRYQLQAAKDAEIKQVAAGNARDGANMIIEYCSPVDEHDYLLRKQISGSSCLQMRRRFMIPTKSDKQIDINGSLVIPIINEHGEVVNCQIIKPDGFKMFLMDAQIIGCYHVIGDIDKSDKILTGEGYATMCTLYDVTSYACVVAFNAGNLGSVTSTIKYLYPDKKQMVCADNDWHLNGTKKGNIGIIKASEAAVSSGIKLVSPPFQRGVTDYNDFDVINGRGDLIKLLKSQKILD